MLVKSVMDFDTGDTGDTVSGAVFLDRATHRPTREEEDRSAYEMDRQTIDALLG